MAKKAKRATTDCEVEGSLDDEDEVMQALQTKQGIATMIITVSLVAITGGMVTQIHPH